MLDGLPPPVKRAFLLRQLDELPQEDIARRLGISLATVKRHLQRAGSATQAWQQLQLQHEHLPPEAHATLLRACVQANAPRRHAVKTLALLLACGAIYMLLGDRQEAAMLLGFVVLVIGISYVQRQRTERSLSALRDLSSPRALVIRDGCQARIAGRELVRGDLVLLAEGDRVPADIALLTASNLTVDESMLTGESVPVVKLVPDCVYAGTLITQGMASGSVTATGAHSALGRIGKGKLLFYAWPGLDVLAQEDFTYPCALDFLPASPLAAIGSWETGMLTNMKLHKETA